MNELKRKRLEAAGWRIGTVQEFLALSDEEAAYIELKLKLADYLRKKRRARHLGQTDLAKLVESSQSRVAKMESGDASVSIDLLIRSLLALGASQPELGRIIARPHPAISAR
jgi:DNA-binding XRE family transcriptional regulator